MKTILVYTGVSADPRLHWRLCSVDLRLHYTTENACHMTIHAGTTTDLYR